MGKAYLILENGAVFEGQTFGYEGETVGELVFNTGMTGYLETLTDPSYYGQIVIQTFPLIGNYGVIPSDFESSSVQVKAYIVREWCQEPSNFRCEGVLDTFLQDNRIPGLYGLDTRALTRIVRESGVMNAMISKKPELTPEEWAALKSYVIRESVENTSTKAAYTLGADDPKYKVALWDFGAKENIARELQKRGCDVTVLPWSATAEEIRALSPDGVMLTNGPGDPADNKGIIAELKKLCTYNIPTFGICLGHQLLALSQGAQTKKLHYGHRGANQPVLETETGRVFVTSQNHGYAVLSDTLPETAVTSMVNCNDGTCEGVTYRNMPVFSVQFHPEACGGPLDSRWLFDKFIAMMAEVGHHAS
ncbi:carbamoyl-phosphate synthase small subunit [Sporobacter termitidis DSM 10068]|uniref:Carbamoyl phosphate synthase small chain n=1 Tax=Sporobacter termitidis DSM 10068 TaxID=1123282 RepID=A0A1M5Y236_9FIRM|nr:carbamoyl phosphate synthase small subunit [Sporobacter termitidis]SHI06131.1 carbamoyl-phosphate synthase small subunit [Sporobacter termitidis DSM 10068]